MRTVLISGVTGQTGSYLAHHLLSKGYRVIGASRDAAAADLTRLRLLGVSDLIEMISLEPSDFRSVLNCVRSYSPDHIYYLAGQTSVGLSFEQPYEAFESIAIGTLNFLEAIKILGLPSRFFNAGSTECFGSSSDQVVVEGSAMRPLSPYAVAKAASFWTTKNYRDAYGIFAVTGMLSNHESPLRPERFVTAKIVNSVRAVKAGKINKFKLGNIDVARDWGWAPDYVQAITLMLEADMPSDYIIATGQVRTLREFLFAVCSIAGLSPGDVVEIDPSLMRPSDLQKVNLFPGKIMQDLSWSSSLSFDEMIVKLYYSDLF